ncbi:trypsin-like serine peptidase [Geodermatophilus sabuli]|uniref:Serine protease n=1 Tax=Geodermatophilus sabuli TaxID=1564158 RepID=A0A285E6L3_9ACTN|nr:trypsin-like peptidase domain-containing protein [Geodermatophilus sabuli]MBB3082465.1 V8-like Glu-specific endopeptidase [Geodermatophilus sabuli]SNX94665.1 V8-like Glu-specific endopeptidase [Geodermatophilus sabuli]
MSDHQSVSGPDDGGTSGQAPGPMPVSGHESVSGGAGAAESAAAMVADSFEGQSGLLELASGFSRDVSAESTLSEQVQISPALSSLPPAESLAFEEPETVCGNDDRVRISPCTSIPWRWICELLVTYPDGAGARGTGWFLGPRTVGTAGHVVFSRANGGWARQIEVIPGMDGASRPFGSQVGNSFRSTNGWVNNTDPEYDYGAIVLPTADLGNTVGFFGFAALSDASYQNLFVNTSGYPGDKPFGTQWFNAGTVTQATQRRLSYMIDTFGGQSGSAVWRLLNNQRHVVGIHGYGGCPNKAVRVTGEVFNNLLAWRNV